MGLFPFDAVHRTIEVKSTAKKSDLEDAEQAALLLHPQNPYGLKIADQGTLQGNESYYPFSAFLAFDSEWNITSDSIPAVLKSQTAACRIVCVLKKNFVSLNGVSFNASDPGFVLRLFAILLFQALESSAESRSKFSLANWLGT
jgi:hypothetical protein